MLTLTEKKIRNGYTSGSRNITPKRTEWDAKHSGDEEINQHARKSK